MALEKEKETYRARLPELEADAGKYVLIHGDEVAGVFDTYDDALTIGYERYGLDPFLVKLIEGDERVHLITRLLAPA